MLDRDLAKAYGVETKALNQAIKRNIKRFEGEDYMFWADVVTAVEGSLNNQSTR